jgi:DNA-binding SARP family transcriptional activator/WD40 repeat protein
MEFAVLGPLTVTIDQEPVNLGGPKQRAVLAMLIAHHGVPVSAESIVGAVYGEDAPAGRRRTVQVYVSTLRSIIGDVIVKRGSGWLLDVPRESVDAARFEDTYESARDMEPDAAASALREALALWRGHAFADIESHGLLTAEVTRLGELRLSAQEARIESDLQAGRDADLVGEIEGLLVEHPYRERFRAQHMLALYRAGRQREALRSFRQMRDLLVDELGVDPTPELRDLEQRILEQDESLVLAPLRSISRRAVLVADPGDPLELARLPGPERELRLAESAAALRSAVDAVAGAQVFVAGAASYVICDEPGAAAAAALSVSQAVDGFGMRMSIDWGDIEIADDAVSGPPVSRAAVLAGLAHVGQVVLSPDAQEAILADGAATGLRFESLGAHDLPGIEGEVTVYQLLVGDPPRTFPPLRTDRIPLPLPDGGQRSVRGYELREEIGTGSIGPLYRAYQPAVGREVAIEVISRAESSGADFIRRFEADAQRLALLDHPNISSPVDYWRDTDGAYVVYRYHRGGPLGGGADATPQLVTQIGSALAYAHSYGVVHGSIRPDRVMLDESGNGYLIGFPVGGVAPQTSQDHAGYIAPEVMAGEPATEATDVYGLGVLAHEMESGVIDADRPLQPVRRAVAQAVSDSPDDRQGSVPELMAALQPDSEDSGAGRFTTTRNPYKGLAAFHESDADDFFGRAALTRTLVEAVSASRFVAVVGPSGIGKSSVVRAGLIPALRRGAVDGSAAWVITDMLPGTRPFLELGRALERVAVDFPASARERFADQQVDALQDLERVLPDGSELLVVIDQFEELFTMTDEATARAFLAMLEASVDDDRVRVVVTLRADFLDRPLLISSFGELLGDNMVTVPAPGGGELAEAIVGPANGVGVGVDAALVERITADVLDQPGALPLLQHALAELFDSRDSDLLGLDAYTEIGGVNGSLAGRAEAAFNRLEAEQQAAIRQVFLRLVTVVDDAAPTRRRVRVADLTDIAQPATIDGFVRARLLVNDNDPDTRMPTVEVAHEALLTHWPRLAGWIDASREELALSRRLDEAIADWETNSRDDAYLLTGGRLAQHQAWTGNTSIALTETETRFLELSTHADHRARTRRRRLRTTVIAGFATAAVIASALAIFGLRKADEAAANEAFATEKAAEAAANEALATEKAAEAAESAEVARARAEEAATNAQLARARELAASSIGVVPDDPELAVLLAVAAADAAPDGSRLFSEGISSLREAMDANRLLDRLDAPPGGAAFTPDDSSMLVLDGDQLLTRRDLEAGRLARIPTWELALPIGNDVGSGVVLHPAGDVAAVLVTDSDPGDGPLNRVLLVDAERGQVIGEVPVGDCEQVLFSDDIPYFTSDGSLFGFPVEAAGPQCGLEPGWSAFVLVDTRTWDEVARFDRATATFPDDMTRILIDHFTGPAELRAYPSLELLREFDIDVGHGLGPPASRHLSADGRTILLVFANEFRPGFWDVESDELIGFGEDWDGFMFAGRFMPDGRMLAMGSQKAVLYDPRSGRSLLEFPASQLSILSTISNDGRLLAALTFDAGVQILTLDTVRSYDTVATPEFVWFNPDQIEVGADTTVLGYSLPRPDLIEGFGAEYRRVGVLAGDGSRFITSRRVFMDYAQLHDGRIVLTAHDPGADDHDAADDVIGPLLVWDPVTGTETVLNDCTVPFSDYRARSDLGKWLEWRGGLCEDGGPFVGHAMAQSPDGRTLAVFGLDPADAPPNPAEPTPNTVVQIWDVESWSLERTIDLAFVQSRAKPSQPHYGEGWMLLFAQNDRPTGASMYVFDSSTGDQIARLVAEDDFEGEVFPFLESNAVSADFRRLYALTYSGSVVEYETESWTPVRRWTAVDGRPRGIALSPDGAQIAVSSEGGFITIWNLEPDEPEIADRIPVGAWASDMVWLDDGRLGATVTLENWTTEWRVYELDPDAVLGNARDSLVRSFTDAECRLYKIDPCPTLAEIQNR